MRRVAVFSLVFVALVSLGTARADAPRKQPETPPPAHDVKNPPAFADNPYFERDESDPRVLHKKPGSVVDKGYVQRMARPPLPATVLDELEALSPSTSVRPLSDFTRPAPGAIAHATVLNGDIIVVEGSSNTVANTGNGFGFTHNGNGLQATVGAVFQLLGDNYDFITVFTTFSDFNVAAYYMPLQNDTLGLGECDLNRGRTFGCRFQQFDGQLQGFVFMNSLDSWRDWDRNTDGVVHPFSSFDASVYAVLGQEVAHRWGSGLRFRDPRNGSISKKLLGRDESHWAAWVDTDASVMDGWDWVSDSSSAFTLTNDMDNFSTLDLYTMGAVPVASAKPFFFIDEAFFVANPRLGLPAARIPADAVLSLGIPSVQLLADNDITIEATGDKVDLTIQDIVNAEGNRCPDPDHAQKSFKQAVVLVTRPGESAAQAAADVADLAVVMETWERWWSDRTEKRLTLCTALQENCLHAEAELRDDELTFDGDVFEAGSEGTLTIQAVARGTTVKNATLRVSLSGNGAEYAETEAEIDVGDIAAGATVNIDVPVNLADDYPCGFSTIVEARLVSENAADAVQEYRLFPGYEQLEFANFEDDEDFEVNQDGEDSASRGGLELVEKVELSCEMTRRTPERDASPRNDGAFLTGLSDELDGDTTLWSPKYNLSGTTKPEFRFNYWLDGQAGDSLKVQLSRDGGESFVTAAEYTESFHGWVLGRAVVDEVFAGQVPDEVVVRFLFNGEGQLEGGIDEVRLLDFAGQCRSLVAGCGCNAAVEGGSAKSSAAWGLLPLVLTGALLGRRRRQRRA